MFKCVGCVLQMRVVTRHVTNVIFLRSFLRRHFAGKPAVASPNVGCFLRLEETHTKYQFAELISILSYCAGKSSEEDNKSRVAAIHDLKEKLKSENDELKKIKHKLKDVQEKQKAEKEVSLTDYSVIKKHFY